MKRILLSCLECSIFYFNGGFGDFVIFLFFKKNNNNLFKYLIKLNFYVDKYYNFMLYILYVYNVIVFWYGFLKGILNLGFLVCDFWLGVVDFFIFVYILNKFIVFYLYVLFFIKFC